MNEYFCGATTAELGFSKRQKQTQNRNDYSGKKKQTPATPCDLALGIY
jgi:hypothetical protein